MRESSKKNLKIIWIVTVIFGLISLVTFITFAKNHGLWLLIPAPFVIVIAYYISLFFKYESYSILFDKKGYDTAFMYMDPFYVLFKDPDKRVYGRAHNKNYFSIGEVVPKFNLPQNKEEFDKLKADFTFTQIENIMGSLVLLILSCLLLYFSYIYIFIEVLLYLVDMALIFLILFSSTQILFTILEGGICLGIPNDKIDTKELDEEGNHIIKHVLTDEQFDYLVACKILVYGIYNERNIDVKRDYLLSIISDYLDKELTVEDISKDDIRIVDFILRDYMDLNINRLNVGIEKYLNYLIDNFEEIAINKSSRFKEDIKPYLIICSHMVSYYIKQDKIDKAKDIYYKLEKIDFDKDKDKELIYLKMKNAALLNIEEYDIDDVLSSENIVYNGLDMFSKFTVDYIENEKDYKYLYEDKTQRMKRKAENILKKEAEEENMPKEEKREKKHKFSFGKKKNNEEEKREDEQEVKSEETFEYDEEIEKETDSSFENEFLDDENEEAEEENSKQENEDNEVEEESKTESNKSDDFWKQADEMLNDSFLK